MYNSLVDAITTDPELMKPEVPMKPALLATLKSNNYLLNCMLAMAAQERFSAMRSHPWTLGTMGLPWPGSRWQLRHQHPSLGDLWAMSCST
eukprot:Skav231701  [mRNA]  locus=scaffold1306:48396:57107:- [translate_table: standard]